MEMTTLQTIADYAGVSVSTASMAVRDHHAISFETKRRVWEAQEKFNYRLQMRRRNGRGKLVSSDAEVRNIAFLLIDRDLAHAGGYGQTFQNITTKGYAKNWRTLLVTTSLEALHQGVIPEALRNGEVQGIVVAGVCDREAHLRLLKLGIPMVKAGNYSYDDEEWMTCEPNFDHGVRVLIQRLQDFGHRRVGLLLGDVSTEFGQHIREYVQREAGLRNLVNAGVACQMHREGGTAAAVRELMKNSPTAIILGSRTFAPEVYDTCEDQGIRIPEDLSVLSIGGSGMILRPSLAHVDFTDYSAAVISKLERLMEDPKLALTRELFPMRFVPGGSLGDCPEKRILPSTIRTVSYEKKRKNQ